MMHTPPVRRTLLLIFVLNITVALLKAVFGLLAGSVSMVADALHSVFDSSSNVIGILAVTVALMPPDETHQYGHGKFETLGTLVIGAMLLLTAYWIVSEGYARLVNPVAPDITPITVGVMLTTLLVNIGVSRYERRKGDEYASEILLADAAHTRSDVYVSLSVLAGFLAVRLGYPLADPIIAFAIGALILRMGLTILYNATQILSDAANLPCDPDDVYQIVRSIPGISDCHNFRCRGKPGELFADIHVTVDPQLPVDAAHALTVEVERRLAREIQGLREIVVHVEPADP
ncbi:cation transporter [Methanoculleus sp. FWC-SCC1]|uniref:Cation transporter n=1 Tax=Methanoculleus frigidifontis TaxID=2584085 RepID=A0ABT8M9Y5_9EURY|nr:cation diffusion facilitator family transporter [Methanoculleus sp. FWC-SCC1]MDN7024748.1 cation transporter [Methanoculleus sp. FWC-SCC1]